ncbi:MAG: polysaccharide biosynthesis C-terminal domain-containing protein [Planctomycetes bacterium]|nr:polysaccharide biosynthesis C-terminal domain-containing protein [Planctomycetota bacterium]
MQLRLIARTATANLIRFGSGLVMLIATPFLLNRFGSEDYSVWVIVIQVTTYVSMLEVGIGDAIVRFVAPHARAHHVDDAAIEVMRAGFVVETVFASAGAVLAGVLSALVPVIFAQIPDSSLGVARSGFLIVGLASAAHLFVAPIGGYFNAIQRNMGPAVAMLAVRVIAMVGVVLAASHGLRAAAVALAVGLVVNLVVQTVLFRLDFRHFRLFGRVSGSLSRAIFSHCSTMMIWSAAGFMVSGLDTGVVGAFDFGRVGPYAIAASATALVFGIHSALISAFIPDIARHHAAGDREGVTTSVLTAADFANLYLLLACAATAAYGRTALRLWLGEGPAQLVYPLFVALVIAKTAGALLSPYVAGLIGSGDHRRVRATPLIEGISNLGASIVLTWQLGAIGAALGTLVGCMVGAGLHLGYNVPRTTQFDLPRARYFTRTVLPATVAAAPLGVVGLLQPTASAAYLASLAVATLATVVLALRIARRAIGSRELT